MHRCDASANMGVYLKAVDSQGHIKAFIVRCGWQPMGVYLKAVKRHNGIKAFIARCVR